MLFLTSSWIKSEQITTCVLDAEARYRKQNSTCGFTQGTITRIPVKGLVDPMGNLELGSVKEHWDLEELRHHIILFKRYKVSTGRTLRKGPDTIYLNTLSPFPSIANRNILDLRTGQTALPHF